MDTCFFAPKIENGVTGEVTNSDNEYDDILININDEMKFIFSFSNLEIFTSNYWILKFNIHTEDINSIETKQEIRIRLDVINKDIKMSDVTYMAFEYCDYKEKDSTDEWTTLNRQSDTTLLMTLSLTYLAINHLIM